MNNILFFTRVDRSAFIQKIKQYIDECYPTCKIIVLSDNKYSPNYYFADDFLLLPETDLPISDILKTIIIEHNIKGIFVASNYDIKYLLQIEAWLIDNNIAYYSPNGATLEICLSKMRMFEYLSSNNILTPQSMFVAYGIDEINMCGLNFPLIIKPDNGQGSNNVHIILDKEDLQYHLSRIEQPIVQKYISGTNFTIDCFNDMTGNVRVCVPRHRVIIEGAHSAVCEIVLDESLHKLAKCISDQFVITGAWNFQAIKNKSNYYIHDINPRIASGLMHSIISGVHFEKYIVDLLLEADNVNYDYIIRTGQIFSQYRGYVAIMTRSRS